MTLGHDAMSNLGLRWVAQGYELRALWLIDIKENVVRKLQVKPLMVDQMMKAQLRDGKTSSL